MIFKFLLHMFAVTNVALLAICAYSLNSDTSYPGVSSLSGGFADYGLSRDSDSPGTQSFRASDREMP
jgi:hypothetical protein